MQDSTTDTAMVHFECHTCHMTATCVATAAAELAWLDHMDNHAEKKNYSAWSWTVARLPLDVTR